MRPGDVLTMCGGTTVEVTNTDAEGRLILADALAMAAEAKPDVILDIATLTGHMVVALGDKVAGVIGDDDDVAARLAPRPRPPARRSGGCRSPTRCTRGSAGSKVADLAQHNWVRWGGGLYAAAFLREFVDGIAVGPPRHRRARLQHRAAPAGHTPSGGTGFGVATLVEYVDSLA